MGAYCTQYGECGGRYLQIMSLTDRLAKAERKIKKLERELRKANAKPQVSES